MVVLEDVLKSHDKPSLVRSLDYLLNDKLNVIMVVSNPCEYQRRWVLAQDFIRRMEHYPGVNLYQVELVYGNQTFHLTDPKNPKHLQLRTEHPVWHKENMINIGIRKLLPPDWTNVAWIDADLEFENIHWAEDTLKLLQKFDIIQCFSHCLDLDADGNAMSIWQGGAYQYSYGMKRGTGVNYWHCGYAWACTRDFYDRSGGLFEESILGSGDYNMFMAWLGDSNSIPKQSSREYLRSVQEYTDRVKGTRISYTPGVIRHYYHGSKANRKYRERWVILTENGYDPSQHLTRNSDGILIPTEVCPPQLLADIWDYFRERNEDN